jgi:2'-5' RNA ligase
MYYGLVHFPKIDYERINQIRRKYDPTVDLIEPHITVVFPVPDIVGEVRLVRHITQTLTAWRPFRIHIRGYCKSWDHWFFLTLEEGNSEVIRLHSEIYTGMLARYRRADIEYIPHIGLGLFVEKEADYDMRDPQQMKFNAAKYAEALRQAEALGLEYDCVLDRLHLVKLAHDYSRIETGREFPLGE